MKAALDGYWQVSISIRFLNMVIFGSTSGFYSLVVVTVEECNRCKTILVARLRTDSMLERYVLFVCGTHTKQAQVSVMLMIYFNYCSFEDFVEKP